MSSAQQKSEPQVCPNCGHAFAEGDKYCGKCSQKRHLHMNFGGLLHDFIHTTLHLDGKFFKMLYCLFLPGRLTNDFLEGKQKRYPHPVRFFVVVSAAFLFYTFRVLVPDFSKVVERGLFDKLPDKSLKHLYMPVAGPTISYALRAELFFADSSQMSVPLPDSVKAKLLKTVFGLERDSVMVRLLRDLSESKSSNTLMFTVTENQQNLQLTTTVPLKDLLVMHPDTILVRYQMDSPSKWKHFVRRQAVKLSQEPIAFLKSYVGKFTAAFILMMLFQALFMKLLYRRQNRHYAEHVLFLMNLGTAMLISLMFVFLLVNWLNLGWLPVRLWIIGLLLFHLFSLKAVYKQPWPKTILKFFLYSAVYLAVGILTMVLTTFATVLIFD